ncbi:MAG: hypothetical protein ACR2P0_08815 [Acidimicrobiales bacterium]
MKHSTDLIVEAEAGAVGDVLADLATYPHWNDVVRTAISSETNDSMSSPAWITTLEARVGVFARSKQLRFIRALDEPTDGGGRRIRFDRYETDGRQHAAWTMHASVEPATANGGTERSAVTLQLAYDGGLWTSALDPVLGAAIERATRRLAEYVASRS